MPVSVVVGGQYGGEGKGKVTSHLVRNRGYQTTVRCGGPNSGHTVTIDGKQVVLRQVPAGVVDDKCRLYLAAGCLVNKEVLQEEIQRFGLSPDRLVVDEHAVVIEREHIRAEEERKLRDRIGSTCTGTGEAVAARAKRTEDLTLARDDPDLQRYTDTVAERLHAEIDVDRNIVIEGTQGFGLSVYHSPFYPKATSRDTTVAGFLSEVGLGHEVDEVIMVIRTFPIRVPGNSGPFFGKETSWEKIREESGYPHEIREYTSVTGRERRVAHFDEDLVEKAVKYNQPTQIAFMGMDYINYKNTHSERSDELSEGAVSIIQSVKSRVDIPVTLVGIGPKDHQILDMINEKGKQGTLLLEPEGG